jgi:cell division protein FtsZ
LLVAGTAKTKNTKDKLIDSIQSLTMIRQASLRMASMAIRSSRSMAPVQQGVAAAFQVSPSSTVNVQQQRQKSNLPESSSLHRKALDVLRNHTNNNNNINSSPENSTAELRKAKAAAEEPDGARVSLATATPKIFPAAVDDVSDSISKTTEDTVPKIPEKVVAAPKPEETTKPRLQPQHNLHEFAPKIVVVGVGGAGGNALNNMIAKELNGVDFLALNTDAQHLSSTLTDQRLQLGVELTKGLGCGANPDAGAMAAEESRQQIQEQLEGAHLVFITAGMGGGTGTGAAPVVADICYEMGILTVGVVTLPFTFEGTHRRRLALEGIERLQAVVDTLIVIPNQNLFQIAGPETTFVDAFQMADDVLLGGVKSITDLMTSPGLINLDFADVQAVMVGMGNALLGTGVSNEAEDRSVKAAQLALQNPLLGDTLDITTAKGMLVNITGGKDMTLFEVDRAAQLITQSVQDDSANIIFGTAYDSTLEGSIRVSVVATGIDRPGFL